jgi:hypothetical protein
MRWSFLGAVVLTIALLGLAGMLLLSRETPGQQLNALLHGRGSFLVTKLKLEIWNAGKPEFLEVTDKTTLDLFSADLRHASPGATNAGLVVQSTLWLKGRTGTRATVILPPDLTCLVISQPTFMDIRDPECFCVPLSPRFSNALYKAIGTNLLK